MARFMTILLRECITDDIRREKGWSYELWPFGLVPDEGFSWIHYNMPVQPDRTADAIHAIEAELRRLVEEPLSPDELSARTRSLMN